jgi:hypothetical protein
MHWVIKHQWLAFRRSPAFEKDLGVKIFLGVVGMLFLLNLVFLSAGLGSIIDQFRGESSKVDFINQFVLYYFLTELGIRYFLQPVPVLDVEPYLHLPIRKKFIANYLLVKSFFSAFNLLAPAVFIPIFISVLIPEIGVNNAIVWLSFNLLISLSLHFFNIIFKKKLENNTVTWIIIVILFGANYILGTYFNFELLPFHLLLESVVSAPVLLVAPIFLAIVMVLICYHFFTNYLYLEDLSDAKMLSGEKFTAKLGSFEAKGLINTLIVQELKLILRHKRSRSALLISLLFLFYPLLIITRDDGEISMGTFMIASILLTGIFIMNYGQFLWSWNTNQMDFFLTKINPYTQWIESRYRLLLYSALIASILATPYIYFGWEILPAIVATALYNIGINSMLVMRMSLWSPKAIDLNKSSMMNYEGTGAAQFLIGLPVILGPMALYGISYAFGFPQLGMLAVGLIGIIGIALRSVFFKAIASKLKKDKYKLIHDLTL